MTSPASRSAISSLGAASGRSPPAWRDGMTLDLFGAEAAHASHSARLEKGSEQMTQGICGRTFIGSSVPAGPLSSWESRLRERLGTVGSTESALIWREKVTPAGASISRLAPSTRHTNGTGSIGSQWSTPRASDGEKGGPNMSFGAGGQPLPAQMHQAHWTTVSATDCAARENRYAQGGNPLTMQMAKAIWPTVLASDDKYRLQGDSQQSNGLSATLIHTETAAHGREPTGLIATTARRGAPNPEFAFWLMGFPDEWTFGALAAMRLYRSSRRKSSAPSSKRS
ncbi:MAG: methyltransferase [Devosia sp.]|nr:methyltransferase [Devosia sp.]